MAPGLDDESLSRNGMERLREEEPRCLIHNYGVYLLNGFGYVSIMGGLARVPLST